MNFQLIFKQGARKSTNSWRTQIIYRRIQPIARSIAIKQKKPEKINEVKEIQEKTATRNHKSERNKITKILRKTQTIKRSLLEKAMMSLWKLLRKMRKRLLSSEFREKSAIFRERTLKISWIQEKNT